MTVATAHANQRTLTPPAAASHVRPDATARSPRAARRRWLLPALSVLVVISVTLFAVSLFAPQVVDKVVGNAQVAIEKQVHQILSPGDLPELRIGAEGGTAELDLCDGTFTEMVGYRADDVLPLYAAHNICGGGIILGWPLGQHVRVSGSDAIYEVVEERYTPKGSPADVLAGMAGELMVQTCVFGENRMRIISLAVVGDGEERS
jgi:hypothetical protein